MAIINTEAVSQFISCDLFIACSTHTWSRDVTVRLNTKCTCVRQYVGLP